MGAEELDWLTEQAIVSAKWLDSLPAELLSRAGKSLLDSSSELRRHQEQTPLVDVSLPNPTAVKKPAPTRHAKAAARSVQPPLMMDLESPDR